MTCPICEKDTVAKYRPFCSARCADVDLGKWLTGKYAVPSQSEDEDDELMRAIEQEQKKPH
jgi:endogenous inhibitor of DNA gyrase (YacG/DUF329 family)